MKTYKITYTNSAGKEVIAKSRGENAEEAFEKYANRPVFGGNSIFFNTRLKMYDADTRGDEWAQYIADDKMVLVEADNASR